MKIEPEIKQEIQPMSQEHRDEVYTLWQHYETLLQNYRSLFYAYQAIALTVSGFIMFQIPGEMKFDFLHISIVMVLITIGPALSLYVWIPIVSHAQKMVFFAKWLLKTNTALDATPYDLMGRFSNEISTYHKYIVEEEYYRSLLKGPTRHKLDLIVSYSIIGVWYLLILWWVTKPTY